VPETEKNRASDLPETRFSLQTKLILAFVLVSLIGFVVAFLVLPRIYVQSKEREIEDSKEGNVTLLCEAFDAMTKKDGIHRELAQMAAQSLLDEDQFDLRSLTLSNPISPPELMERLREELPSESWESLEEKLDVISSKFRVVRFIPWEVLPLLSQISLLPRESGFLVPIIVPLSIPDRGFDGTLVLGDPVWENELEFNPEKHLDELVQELQASELLIMVSNILFYSAEEAPPSLYQSAVRDRDKGFSFIEKELGSRRLYVPVYNVVGKDEITGYFCMMYEQTPGLLAWKDLVGGPAYKAFGVAALLAVVFSIFFAKGITRPIQDLTHGAIAIAEGKLDRNVRVASRDEIGVLAFTFNEMTQRLRTTLDQLRERAETIERQNIELDRRFNELRALQNYTENILRTVDSAIFSVDLDGKVRRPNRAAQDLLGLEDAQDFEDVVSESVRDPLRAALDLGESTVSDEISIVSQEGEKMPVALSVSPLREGTEVTGAVAVLTDLQAVKNLEALVSRQERLAALGQLTAGVAHEIRNPLSIIKACAEILQQNFEGQPGENGLCRDIVEEVNRLSRVVSDFLSFAKPIEPSLKSFDLSELIGTVVARLGKGSEETTRIRLDVP
jgi:PAS domain S-box-containing protein